MTHLIPLNKRKPWYQTLGPGQAGRNDRKGAMITFEYMQSLGKLNKEELQKQIDEMPEKEAKELLKAILMTWFGHDRTSTDDLK